MRLGILGGTFDPIHHGHLFIAEEARVRFALEKVLFIPNGRPPHKQDYALTPAQHRLAITELAIQSNPAFACSPMETQRPGPSYTIETLTLLSEQHPEAELFYITGIDAVAEIQTWMRPEEVIRRATFIAVTRPGFDADLLRERLPETYLQRILVLDTTELGISSTDIRARIREGRPARYLTPDSVLDYIYRHRLYHQSACPEERAAGGTNAKGTQA